MRMAGQAFVTCGAAILALAVAGPLSAQDARVELGASAGWTLSDGVSFDGVIAGDGNIYTEIEPKDSASFSANIGFYVTPQVEVGFLWGRQKSTLEVLGTTTREVGDQNIDNYHGYLAYNFGEPDAKARFYVLGGAGATRYGSVPFQIGGSRRDERRDPVLHDLGRRREALPWKRTSASSSARAGRRPTSSPTARAGGATPTGAATS